MTETSEKSGEVVSDPNASNLAPSTAQALDTAITDVTVKHDALASSVAAVAVAHDTLSDRVDNVVQAHANLTQRIEDAEDEVATVSRAVAQLAEGHQGATLVQEIVNFLHRLFPGHGAPGDPTA